MLWIENGLLTVAGGKLTTFRSMAHDALQKIRAYLPGKPFFDPQKRMLEETPARINLGAELSPNTRLRLLGRHGANALKLIEAAQPGEQTLIAGTNSLLAEVRWAARCESVLRLDDLLLRRVRLGILAPQGGLPLLDQLQPVIQSELGWSDQRWRHEADRYAQLWKACYHLN